jgi:hypothetical protein
LANFSDCRTYFALVHRIETHDYIGVYGVEPWGEMSKFKCKTSDVAQIQWVPNGGHIIAIDSPLTYRVSVYSLTGSLVASVEAYGNALGVRLTALHRAPLAFTSAQQQATSVFQYPLPPLQQLAAVASYDGKVRLLSMQSWKVAHVLPLCAPGDMPPGLAENVLPLVEVSVAPEFGGGSDAASARSNVMRKLGGGGAAGGGRNNKLGGFVTRELKALPRRAAPLVPSTKSAPTSGTSWVGWAGDGSLVACREDSQPQCLWVWSALEGRLAALIVGLDG